ncbi:type I restriction-modification system subunit M N-terminal domain-containing protein [Desulfonatronum thioautotrophicum]|uniref:type I restriction-modification system subunit M N-terminal domain-containing protein n=1 Tax=Desulfonatronum thioautotrophicum TaxID=617001 RepID=UPI00069ACE80|nr:type I restriction-modification system subunit M N-terminal domain-containing protein [Desulfonatronum thioautotrophicum]
MNLHLHEQLKAHIWEIANRLRGPYRPPQYRLVMLPIVVLRRLDCVLEPSKDAVLDEHVGRCMCEHGQTYGGWADKRTQGQTHRSSPTGMRASADHIRGVCMKYDPAVHRRRSIRLREYDYAQAGAYFVTICAQDRRCLFGEIVDGGMRLYDAGTMIHRWYLELETKFPDIQCDAFVCMPNHVHFIMINVGADLCVRPENSTASRENERACGVERTQGQTHRSAPTGMRGSADHIRGVCA